jgi:predicted transposase/invertase (TIGR01784 family)
VELPSIKKTWIAILSKFANLSRQEIEAMLKLPELKKTKVYQEALEEGREEGRQEGREEGKLAAQLKILPKLLQRGDSLEEIADLLELEVEVVREMSQQQK